MKQKNIIFKLFSVFLTVFSLLSISVSSLAYDAIEKQMDPPPVYYIETLSDEETVWHVDVNSGCQYSDHTILLDIDAEPDDIKDPKIKLTNYDVDYNDPQSCDGGPEVDSLYINGNYIGQLKGANNSWSINTFDILPSYLVKGSNEIFIDTDATVTGCWCLGVGYVEISSKVGFKVVQFTPADG